MPKNSQLILKNFNNYNFHSIADPAQLADLAIDSVDEIADFTRTETKVHAKVYKKVPEDVQYNINSSQLKNENLTLWRALKSAGNNLGAASHLSGNITESFTQVLVSVPLVENSNPSSFSTVSLKFVK